MISKRILSQFQQIRVISLITLKQQFSQMKKQDPVRKQTAQLREASHQTFLCTVVLVHVPAVNQYTEDKDESSQPILGW